MVIVAGSTLLDMLMAFRLYCCVGCVLLYLPLCLLLFPSGLLLLFPSGLLLLLLPSLLFSLRHYELVCTHALVEQVQVKHYQVYQQ